MKTFIILIIGMMIGATLGIVLHCMLIVAKESDKHLKQNYIKRSELSGFFIMEEK